jgi:hypothetical protein
VCAGERDYHRRCRNQSQPCTSSLHLRETMVVSLGMLSSHRVENASVDCDTQTLSLTHCFAPDSCLFLTPCCKTQVCLRCCQHGRLDSVQLPIIPGSAHTQLGWHCLQPRNQLATERNHGQHVTYTGSMASGIVPPHSWQYYCITVMDGVEWRCSGGSATACCSCCLGCDSCGEFDHRREDSSAHGCERYVG